MGRLEVSVSGCGDNTMTLGAGDVFALWLSRNLDLSAAVAPRLLAIGGAGSAMS